MKKEPETLQSSEPLDDSGLPQEQNRPQQEEYTPRPLGVRIFALVLAVIVIIGVILWYYNIFTAGK